MVAFDVAREAESRSVGYGMALVAAETPRAFGGRMTCRRVTLHVLPDTPALDERAVEIPLARCAWDEAPTSFLRLVGAPVFVIGAGAGVVTTPRELRLPAW